MNLSDSTCKGFKEVLRVKRSEDIRLLRVKFLAMATARRLHRLRSLNLPTPSSILSESCLPLGQTHSSENPRTPTSKLSVFSNNFLKMSLRMQNSGAENAVLRPFFFANDRARFFSAKESNVPADHSKEIDEINMKFAEAREEIEMAMESKETVYFDEEADSARKVVVETLEMYNSLLNKLAEAERGILQRSMGLKMEQLKAELQQLDG